MGHTDSPSPSTSLGRASFAADVLSRFAPQLERYEASLAQPVTPPSEPQQQQQQQQRTSTSSLSPGQPASPTVTAAHISKAVAAIVSAIPITESSDVPCHSSLLKLLDQLDQACRSDCNDANPPSTMSASTTTTTTTESLRLAALLRITYAAYALVLGALLNDAGKLNDEAWFWTEIEQSVYRSFVHLVQTLPQRITALVGATLEMAAKNASHTVRGTMDLARLSAPSDRTRRDGTSADKVTFRNTLRTILATPDMVTGILFPYQFKSEGSITFALVQQQARDKQQTRERAFGQARAAQLQKQQRQLAETDDDDIGFKSKSRRRTKTLRSAALKLSPTHMVRHEARCKRKGLMHERDLVAEKLGQLALQQQQTVPSTSGDGGGDDDDGEVSLDSLSAKAVETHLLQDLGAKVHRLSCAFRHDDNDDSGSGEVQIDIERASSSPEALTASLRTLLQETLPRNRTRTRLILSPSRFGQPSKLTQNWPGLVLYPLTALLVSRYVSKNWDGISAKVAEARETVRGFLVGWVWEPCVQLLETVRHGRDESGVIMSRESLQSDLQSLERMVSTFTREKYGLQGAELDAVTSKVRQGDLTLVLKIYEDEIRSPLKSAVWGSLVQSLLIQIQKAKVDLEVAMNGIDKLLKSQQLLFGAVGVAPALGVVYVGTNWIRAKVSGVGGGRAKRDAQAIKVRAWEALRRIDRLLSMPSSTSTLPALTHGLMLLDLSLLRSASYPLLLCSSKGNKALAKRLQRQFLDDVRDLEDSNQPDEKIPRQKGKKEERDGKTTFQPGLGYWSRRAAVERIWRSWSGAVQLGV